MSVTFHGDEAGVYLDWKGLTHRVGPQWGASAAVTFCVAVDDVFLLSDVAGSAHNVPVAEVEKAIDVGPSVALQVRLPNDERFTKVAPRRVLTKRSIGVGDLILVAEPSENIHLMAGV